MSSTLSWWLMAANKLLQLQTTTTDHHHLSPTHSCLPGCVCSVNGGRRYRSVPIRSAAKLSRLRLWLAGWDRARDNEQIWQQLCDKRSRKRGDTLRNGLGKSKQKDNTGKRRSQTVVVVVVTWEEWKGAQVIFFLNFVFRKTTKLKEASTFSCCNQIKYPCLTTTTTKQLGCRQSRR